MNTRKSIIKLLEDALQKENKKMQHATTAETQQNQKVKTLKRHIQNLGNHLTAFNKQSIPRETKKTLFEVIEALIYIEKDKLDIAKEKKNSEKTELHTSKLDGLASIRDNLPKTDEHWPIPFNTLKEVINTACSKFPELTKGLFSINKALFDEISSSSAITSNNFFPAHTSNSDKAIPKIVLLGDSQVGKSTILLSYTNKKYSDTAPVSTIPIDFGDKNIGNNKMHIWDVTGEPEFRKIASAYVPGASIAILTFDITQQNTFTNLPTWHDMVKINSPEALLILAGTKSDLQSERKVSAKEAAEYAEKISATYTEVSAKNNKNIDALFDAALELLQKSNTPAIKR